MAKSYAVLFGGEAGYGVMSAGSILAKAAVRSGYWSIVVNEYPSLIKGGLNNCLVQVAEQTIGACEETADVLGALSQPAFDYNAAKVKPGGIIFYDAAAVKPDAAKTAEGVTLVPASLVPKGTGDTAKVMASTALAGAFCALTGFPAAAVKAVIADTFSSAEVREKNLVIFDAAYREAAAAALPASYSLNRPAAASGKLLINGNEAISIGAIKAGCKFAAGYPMTPGSSVLTYLADHGPAYGLVFKQAEDEIAAMNMLIGASFAGVRAMGSTSGGGFALMTEALGFAGQAEIPVVMVEAQRGGPSTGLPTRTAQADLNFAVYASQGEFPRFVVAPGDVEECFYETHRLFNLVEQYQVPGIVLTDKYLADTSFTVPPFAMDGLGIDRGKLANEAALAEAQPYLRYRQTADGVSLRAVPGQAGGRHIATSYTHGEDGFYSSGNHEYAGQEPEVTAAGLDKWYRKVPHMEQAVPGIKQYGPDTADLTLIVWGSTKGAALEAAKQAAAEGLSVNVLQILYVCPFPAARLTEALKKVRRSLLIEGNKTAQLALMLRGYTGFAPDQIYLKYDSRPFTPSGILAKIREVL